VKPKNEEQQDPTLLATVSRSTTSYTDPTYHVSDGYTDDLLQYDVRSHFSVNNSYSAPDWHSQFGFAPPPEERRLLAFAEQPELKPTKNRIDNFPNPFNPTTVISFDLPWPSDVELVVYDYVGREVAALVNGYRGVGRHEVTFDGARLSSGVYIYKLIATPLTGSHQPFMQVKRMILSK
jgi:hypothetical protein